MKCFVWQNKQVIGPFDRPQFVQMLEEGAIHKKSRVWWRGQEEWTTVQAFLEFRPQGTDKTRNNKDQQWFLEQDGKTFGPLSRLDMIGHLRGNKNYSNIRIWKRGERARATVYQYTDLSDALGIIKRKSPRAPIVGDVVVQSSQGVKKAKLCSISEGGIGITAVEGLSEGQKLQIEIESPLLSSSLVVEGSVRYLAASGRIGIQFDSIGSESLSTIVEYINQFSKQDNETEKRAA